MKNGSVAVNAIEPPGQQRTVANPEVNDLQRLMHRALRPLQAELLTHDLVFAANDPGIGVVTRRDIIVNAQGGTAYGSTQEGGVCSH